MTPKRAARLKILDPACGSGSFLISAYQYLLDWHRDQYVTDGPEKWTTGRSPTLYQGPSGDWWLTTPEHKRILLNNIYGVDIDAQAVETTKLSLLLKVLEGESEQTLTRQLKLFHERALPDLANNIKCGNSLIGPDFYNNQQMSLLDKEERYRINVFDWEAEFSEIMKAGGFDAVIGNPPYIFTRNQRIDESQKIYFYAYYKHQSVQLNTFGIFVERCHALMRYGGVLGFITPNNWLTIDSFAPLRQFILQKTGDVRIVNILDRVFAAAHVDTAIVIFRKREPTHLTLSEVSGEREVFSHQVEVPTVKPPAYIIQISLLKDTHSREFLERLESLSQPLATFCTVSTGLKAYQTSKGKPPQTDKQKMTRVFHSTYKRDETHGRYLDGVDVCRYYLSWSGEYLSYGDWLAEPRRSVPFAGDRLLVRQIPARPPYLVHGVFTDEPFYNDINSMVIFAPVKGISLKYLLGLINSRWLSFWFLKTFDKLQRKIFPQFKVGELGTFPIRPINVSDPTDKTRHDRMVELVERMLSLHIAVCGCMQLIYSGFHLHEELRLQFRPMFIRFLSIHSSENRCKQLTAAKTTHDKTTLQRQIDTMDRQIDWLVYELYGLAEEEIKIVKETTDSTNEQAEGASESPG